MPELQTTGLRVVVSVAERGSFTSAAAELGYTQSAVSRQVAAVERALGQRLFDRHRGGVRLTAAGARLVPRARRIVDELEALGTPPSAEPTVRVRLGVFPIAAATAVPQALARLAERHPSLVVHVREGTTPALARSLRAATLDLAVIAQSPPYRPLDRESPPFELTLLDERRLMIAVGAEHRFANRDEVDVDELNGEAWVASPADADGRLMGVWLGVPGRVEVRYVVRDWLAKLRLVAAGLGITTVSPAMAVCEVPGVRLVAVRGGDEWRRVSLARLPGTMTPHVALVAEAIVHAVSSVGGGGHT